MSDNRMARHALRTRLRALAVLQLQAAAALVGKEQEELRAHFIDSAEAMIDAVKELAA